MIRHLRGVVIHSATCCLLAMVLWSCAGEGGRTSLERVWWIMGTRLAVRVEDGGRPAAVAVSEAAFAAVRDAERRLSVWQPQSALSRLNDAPAMRSVPVPSALARDIERARTCWRATDGGFDPVSAGAAGPDGQLAAAVFGDLVLGGSSQNPSYTKLLPGVRLDSGGFGKGQALEDAATAVGQLRPRNALRTMSMDFGGQLFWWRTSAGGGWRDIGRGAFPSTVVVADPRRRDRPLLEISLRDYGLRRSGDWGSGLSVATSGSVERGDHIVNPATLKPVSRPGLSVTVLAASPFWADCLSTGLYVLYARNAALAVAAADAQGVDMVAVEAVRDRMLATITRGLADRVSPAAPGVRVDVRRRTGGSGGGWRRHSLAGGSVTR